MLSIGEFSRVARVSTRLLRHYDRLGLLAPAHVDEDTGYRYYTAEQIGRLNRILVLKELGFRLEVIAPMLDEAPDPAALRDMLAEHRREIAETIDREEARLRHVEARIAQLDEAGSLVDDDVIVRSEPARKLFAARTQVDSFAAAKATLGRVMRLVAEALPKRSLGQLAVFSHAETFDPEALDLELGYFVSGDPAPLEADGLRLEVREAPAVEEMAVCVRKGPPDQSHVTTARIARFVEARGYRLEAPSREVFIAPFDPTRPQTAVVEMQFPLRPSQGA